MKNFTEKHTKSINSGRVEVSPVKVEKSPIANTNPFFVSLVDAFVYGSHSLKVIGVLKHG